MADENPTDRLAARHAAARDADAVRHDMAGVRCAFDENVQELVTNARQLVDWRYYVKAAPWGAIGAAIAVGYVLVPRRVQIVQPNAEEIAKLAKRHQIVVEHKAKAEAKKSGPTQIVLSMIANAMLRAATAYVSQQAGKVFGEQSAETPHEPSHSGVRES